MDALDVMGIDQGVHLERSKSKGFHVLVIFSDWTDAALFRLLAKAALAKAGLPPNTEVFPKQDRLTADTPWGNYLNLPYFGGDNCGGRRMIIDATSLTPIPLVEWLSGVGTCPEDSIRSAVSGLAESVGDIVSTNSRPSPDALDLLTHTHGQGVRRPTLIGLAGHLRYRRVREDVAIEPACRWATEKFKPRLPDEEIRRHIRGVYRRYGLGPTDHTPIIRDEIVVTEDLPSDVRREVEGIWQ